VVRDDGGVAQSELPTWVTAATTAAVRLAAEADAEVDEILRHATRPSPERLAGPISRLEQSAEASEVAADLAGLLWAECEDVPPILTILEEPATQAALEAVGEARRQASRRLTAEALAAPASPPSTPSGPHSTGTRAAVGTGGSPPPPALSSSPFPTVSPAPAAAEPRPVIASGALGPTGATGGGRGPATALLAGAAAAALLLFGRRLRRA
jgi:hypothetical protein